MSWSFPYGIGESGRLLLWMYAISGFVRVITFTRVCAARGISERGHSWSVNLDIVVEVFEKGVRQRLCCEN
jgi:hypothetical protein